MPFPVQSVMAKEKMHCKTVTIKPTTWFARETIQCVIHKVTRKETSLGVAVIAENITTRKKIAVKEKELVSSQCVRPLAAQLSYRQKVECVFF